MTEDDIEEGAPPPTNAGYAAAKRSLLHGVQALHEQYGVPYTGLIPANLYGPGDHFGEGKSHFLAACIDKVEEARVEGVEAIEFFGTGRALRQYVFVEDVAGLVTTLVDADPKNRSLNVAPSENRSIRSLAESVAAAASYEGQVRFTGKGPDGQYRKDVSIARLRRFAPDWDSNETSLADGLAKTIDWYREHVATG
jgi:GDP-L-fucose synthase